MSENIKRPSRAEALVAVSTLIAYIGDDPTRSELVGTPARVLRAWENDWGTGYNEVEPPPLIQFSDEDGISTYNELVVVRGITFVSHCAHHLCPFFGTVDIGYIPNGAVVGLSKLARVVDHFSHKLQVQEKLSTQIADYLVNGLSCLGVGVVIRAEHTCMTTRGVRKPGSVTITSALRGSIFSDAKAREEFLRLAHN
jgi:GTP cyclohydrolase I